MTALQTVYPGDTVFTAIDGLGIVESVRGNPPSEALIRFDNGPSKRVVLPSTSLITPSQQGFLVLAGREPARVRELLHDKPDDVIVKLLQDAPGQSMETVDIREKLVDVG